MTLVLDTDILIDFLHKREPSTQFLMDARSRGEDLATTSVNAAELWRGARTPAAREKVGKLLTALLEVPFGPRAARRFGDIMDALDRAGNPITNTDGLIAACALESGARLATRNEKEYRRVPGLEVLVPGKG
jgi:predicted nucleic acid-binding protein